MIQPTKDELRALLNLRHSPDFEIVLSWINKSVVSQSLALNETKAEDTEKQKGRNLELLDFMKYVENAEKLFERSQEPQKGMV